MKKSLLFLVLLSGVLIFSLGWVSAACTTDAECGTVGACVQKDSYGQGKVGECVACTDSDNSGRADADGGVDPETAGTATGVFLTTLSYKGDMVDTCKGTTQVTEFYCREMPGGLAGHLYAYSAVKNCPSGEACSGGKCVKSTVANSAAKSTAKISRAPAFDSGSFLPWVLGIAGILLIAGLAYWFSRKKGSRTKKKK
ncbi:hypothetical protein HZA98_01110 [Candidatus Woesearchaeota archaeon]|nr:hypothetical protein [Candidatus Woesearchaeota archaeon]